MAVTPLLGGATCRITLDQEQFGFGRVFFLTISKLARQRGNAHHALSACFTGLAGRFARSGSVDDLLDQRLGMAGIFLQPFNHLVRHQAFQRLAHFGTDQLVLSLGREFGIRQFDRNDCGQPLAHILTGKVHLLLFEDARLFAIIVDSAGQRRTKSGKMGAAIALRDVIGEAENVFVIAVIPFERDVDANTVTF